MTTNLKRLGQQLLDSKPNSPASGTRFSNRRFVLWLAGLVNTLFASGLLWESINAQWTVGIIIAGAWLLNIVFHIVGIDLLLQSLCFQQNPFRKARR